MKMGGLAWCHPVCCLNLLDRVAESDFDGWNRLIEQDIAIGEGL